jgi:acyl phosphate:glycerol-3-phosphate acyltransferase
MTAVVVPTLTLVIAYLLGAIPFGYLVARSRGVDILHQGSGNIGATNVGRILGRRLGIVVFVLDFAKGAIPAALATWLEGNTDWNPSGFFPPDSLRVAAGLAAFLGHLFPIYLRFRGGKGVATGAGVVAVLLPIPLLVGLLVWVAVLSVSRYVSLSSVMAVLILTAFRLATTPYPFGREHGILSSFCLLAAVLVIARHRTNLQRLFQASENRLAETPTMLLLTKTIHVLAVGLWFGSAVFFTISGVVMFQAFEEVSIKPRGERPLWFPEPAAYYRNLPSDKFPEPLRKEQGSRAFGTAVGPLFPWYFGIQGVCGLLAAATALTFARAKGSIHRVRSIVLVAALLTVAVGVWVERVVDGLRVARNETTDAVLSSSSPTADEISQAETDRAQFGRWHGYSLMLNMIALLLVTVGMAMAAALPASFSSAGARDAETNSLATSPPHQLTALPAG